VALVAFPSPDLKGSIDDSAVARALLDTAPAVLAFLPGQFEHAIHLFLDGVQAAGGIVNPGGGATPTATP